MTKKEKEALKKAVEYKGGLIPKIVFNNMIERNGKIENSLIASGYIDEVSAYVEGKTYMAYRPSEKGFMIFKPFYKRAWVIIKKDFRTIVVAIITTLVITIITTLIK